MAAEDYVGPVGHEKKFHKTHFDALDIQLRATRDNGYVWVRKGGNQILVKREVALQEGWDIVKQKRRRRASVRREEQYG